MQRPSIDYNHDAESIILTVIKNLKRNNIVRVDRDRYLYFKYLHVVLTI